MLFFIFKRLLAGILVSISVIIIVSSIIYLAPVDPTRLTFGQRSDDSTITAKREALGLDKPLYVQMLYYIRDISPLVFSSNPNYIASARFVKKRISLGETKLLIKSPDLRDSFQSARSVASILREVIPLTVLLAFCSLFIATILGILFGFIAAINKDKFFDTTLVAVSTLGYSVPSYVSAIILAIIFGYLLSDVTGLRMQGSLYELNDIGDPYLALRNIVLPSIALGIRPISVITQISRSAILDTLSQDYVRTAVAKGVQFKNVLKKHVFKNSMNPVISVVSGWLASLLTGAFFVEYVFSYKGLGYTTVTALLNYDIPVILGSLLFVSIVFVFLNITVDILYKAIDPRENF